DGVCFCCVCCVCLSWVFFFFFFSSRRRHTRWPRDWSSDVCSSDLGALATAAGLAALVWALPGRGARPAPAEATSRQFQFVVVAPRATRVALVGDFNDWDATRTPMRPSPRGGSVWTAVLPLSPGRYRYAFLVDGSRWLADPAAPHARDDEFGAPSSVVTVGGS